MKETTSSSLEVKFNISEHIHKYKKRCMLIPFGYPKNFEFMEKASPGDIVSVANGDLIRIIQVAILNINNPATEIFSQAIYELPAKDLMLKFMEQYGDSNIQHDELIVITYDIVE